MPDRVQYVLDTCVLLADPQAPYRFEEHEVVLPLVVVEELDRNKARMDEVGRHARTALRILEELRVRSGNGLSQPVVLPARRRPAGRVQPRRRGAAALPRPRQARPPHPRVRDGDWAARWSPRTAALRIKGSSWA